jgi:copper chaperone CopZ
MILNNAFDECVPKLQGCIIPMEQQDRDSMEQYWDNDVCGYVCPECLSGYYYSEEAMNCLSCA